LAHPHRSEFDQYELIGALRSANVKIQRYEKCVAQLTLMVQELLDEPRNKNKMMTVAEKPQKELP
jgi:hypothetical protein